MPNLVGIGNSQAPTNAMLGGLAYQDSVGEINIDKIKARIETPLQGMDMFVYDTRKDSDGGAWRHRTQNTSWYNESVSETRGARKEFPAVAVIVIENGGTYEPVIKIYDGDDPNLPMWMVFKSRNAGGGDDQRTSMKYYAAGPYSIRKVVMLNGVMVDCQYRSGGHVANIIKGVTRYNFINDSSIMMTDEGDFKRNGNLGDERNIEKSYTKISTNEIVHTQCNDVAITVLPNAPIDASTGLPVPTIAVATDGGISVITDSGVVYDLTTNNEGDDIAEIAFLSDTRYSFATKADNSRWWVDDIQTADENSNYFYQRTTFDYSAGSQVSVSRLGRVNGTSRGEDEEAIFRQASGMSRVRYVDRLVNYTTSDYNTGWMDGEIEGAFLSDTDDTDLAASDVDLVTNGTFASDSDWTKDGSWTISGGTATNSGAGQIYQTISVVTGKRYLMTATVNLVGDGAVDNTTIGFRDTANSQYYAYGGGGTGSGGGNLTANVVNHFSLYWTSTITGNVRVRCYSVDSLSIDNWSVQDVSSNGIADRSVNNKGLQVFGTITKTPVATGAELVAFGPFSGSEFFRQPPNSNMNIGTGDAYEMIWFKTTNTSNTMMLMSYEGGANGTNDYGKPFNLRYESGVVRGWASHNAFSTYDDVSHGTSTADGKWHCAAWVKRGAVFELYVNGEFIGSDTGAVGSNALSDANSELVIGARKRGKSPIQTHEEPFFGSLALARIGKSAPSAELIKKMYNDEKCLFHENAKCTLHGTSDDVKALAFDTTNNILHAGTSSGRSEFQGLNRINNTTTAVTTAISASDGFVAEQ